MSAAPSPFGARLRAAMDARGPLCVGIDPHPSLLRAWDLPDTAAGLRAFTAACIDALAGEIAVLKPQSAFFERHGAAGAAVLEEAIAAARSAGALVLLDAKRGDIGSTMQGYAEAYLAPDAPMAVDALTVSPFLGFGSLRPALDVAAGSGAGVFVLALTSNPEGASVQRAATPAGTVAGDILAAVAAENASARPLGSVGAVVAATVDGAEADLDVNGPLLAPGLGAQGATAADLRRTFGPVAHTVLPSTSREVLAAGPTAAALRDAALRTRDTVAAVLVG